MWTQNRNIHSVNVGEMWEGIKFTVVSIFMCYSPVRIFKWLVRGFHYL